jgi:hypothetical protein
MNNYWVKVWIKYPDGSTHEFLTGCEATDLNDAWKQSATRYTGKGSVWYPDAQLRALQITPYNMEER